MRILPAIVVVFLALYSFTAHGDDTVQLEVRVGVDSFDGGEIWVGVLRADDNSSLNGESWVRESARDFSVDVPAGGEDSILVFIKKNYPPVTLSITPELIKDGLELEFSSGISIFGSVSTTSGQRITEGSVSLDRIHDFKLVPPDPALLSWEIAEDGTYEIHGLQPELKYELRVSAPEYMPALEEMMLSVDETRREVNFQLARATYVTGRIVDRYGSVVRGEFKTVVTPIESQTTKIQAKFDLDDNFRIGPFAEGVTVELTAHDDLERRTKVVEVQTPAADVQMLMLRWISLFGKVLNRETGEPVEEFQLLFLGDFQGLHPIDVFAPDGHFEVKIDDLSRGVSIVASGFLRWESSRSMELDGRESYDLGTIELNPAHTVRGRVSDRSTQLPIESAKINRIEYQEGVLSPSIYHNVRTVTDSDGEFEVFGFPSANGNLSVYARGYQRITVTVGDVETYLEIELDPRIGSVSGRVVSVDGDPLYPAAVSIGLASKRNSEDGSFTFDGITGTYRISARADSGHSNEIEVTIENGEHISDLELVINESEFGRVHGTVLGLADGERGHVIVGDIRGRELESDGTYEVRGVPKGEHEVICKTSFGRQLSKTIELNETLDVQIAFVFEGKSSIMGRVLIVGEPAAGLKIQATPENENHARSQTTTLKDGTYVIEGLDEGDYALVVTSRGISHKVAIEGITHFDFDLGSNVLSGHIQSSEPVRGVHVNLTGFGSIGRFQLHTTVDSSGFYQFRGIASGSYEITASLDNFETKTREIEIETSVQDLDIFIKPTERN